MAEPQVGLSNACPTCTHLCHFNVLAIDASLRTTDASHSTSWPMTKYFIIPWCEQLRPTSCKTSPHIEPRPGHSAHALQLLQHFLIPCRTNFVAQVIGTRLGSRKEPCTPNQQPCCDQQRPGGSHCAPMVGNKSRLQKMRLSHARRNGDA